MYKKLTLFKHLRFGGYEELFNFVKLLEKLKLIKVVSLNAGRFVPDAYPGMEDPGAQDYVRLVMKVDRP